MDYLKGQPREQLTLYTTCLDDMIPAGNTVRAIDAFVSGLDMRALGFGTVAAQGRPPYDPADLLKLYIYGYMNRMRSSRRLEKECGRNIEVIWLLKNLRPDHNTIARFRKQNPKAVKRVFRAGVDLAKNHNLIGALLIAGDSTKLRAQNSKKNNYNKKKVQRHLEYIDKKLAEHEQAMAEADGDQKQVLEKQMCHRREQQGKYEKIGRELEKNTDTGNPQISTSDPDCRHQIVRGSTTEVCYSAQTTVDAKNKIIIDCKVTNQNDKKAMGNMLQRTKAILKTNAFTALYDKGYHTGSEFKVADDLGIDTLVAIPGIGRKSQAPDPRYNVEHFPYDRDYDSYTCPQGHILTSNGSWYRARNYRFKQYRTKACKGCPARHLCTTAKQNGKIVQRSEFTTYIEANAKRMAHDPITYKKRQALVEHPFGTIKRQWGFDHIITKKGIDAASADFALMALAYNLKRIFNILGKKTQYPNSPFKTLIWAMLRTLKEMISTFCPKIEENPKTNFFHIILMQHI